MMKYLLEQLLSYGRDRSPGIVIGASPIDICVDYKTILASTYISRRALELSIRPVEIGFVYGGKSREINGSYTISIDDLFIPIRQRITAASFHVDPAAYADVNEYFRSRARRVVGQGHSHSEFEVFHSTTDVANYKAMLDIYGLRINHRTPVVVVDTRSQYNSFSRRLGQLFHFSKTRMQEVQSSHSNIFPSLVFNARGEHVDAKVAVRSYGSYGTQYGTRVSPSGARSGSDARTSVFRVVDCGLRIHNKQTVLTTDEKITLDNSVRRVLSYNGLLKRESLLASCVRWFGDALS